MAEATTVIEGFNTPQLCCEKLPKAAGAGLTATSLPMAAV